MKRTKNRRPALVAALLLGVTAAVIIAVIALHHTDEARPAVSMPEAGVVDAAAGSDATVDAAREAAPPDARRKPKPTHRISSRELRAMTRRYRGMIQLCYRRAARGGARVSRKAQVRIRLADGGRVRSVRVDAGDKQLAACLRRTVHAWRFPRSSAAQGLTFPIVYAR